VSTNAAASKCVGDAPMIPSPIAGSSVFGDADGRIEDEDKDDDEDEDDEGEGEG